jgi:hypothetical protein
MVDGCRSVCGRQPLAIRSGNERNMFVTALADNMVTHCNVCGPTTLAIRSDSAASMMVIVACGRQHPDSSGSAGQQQGHCSVRPTTIGAMAETAGGGGGPGSAAQRQLANHGCRSDGQQHGL